MPFHANFDSPIYEDVRRCTSAQFRPKSVSKLADRIRTLANERLDELLPRGAFDLTQDYGGIVAASVVCELVGLPADLAAEVLATVNAGSLAQPGERRGGGATPGPATRRTWSRSCERRRADGADGEPADRRQPDRLPAARRFGVHRHRGGHADAGRVHRRHRDRAEDRRARAVGTEPAARPAGRGARRSRRQRARRARGDDPLLRAGAVVRPNRAQAVHHSRHHDQSGPARSSHCSRRPAATSASTPIPTSSSGTGPSSACWPSAAGSTSASGCTWPDWRSRS